MYLLFRSKSLIHLRKTHKKNKICLVVAVARGCKTPWAETLFKKSHETKNNE